MNRWQVISSKTKTLYRNHSDFILLLILFATFRWLTLVAYRPGGLVLDFSDFYWYRAYAELTRQGYLAYENLWSAYPPIFPLVMVATYQISSLLPPWNFASLWFTLLLGGFFFLFEIGNFILLYLLALKVHVSAEQVEVGRRVATRCCWIYAAMFVPVYTLTGHFESFPIFFFLLSIFMLLLARPWQSSFYLAIGFMIKFIPVILIPISFQLITRTRYRLAWHGLRFSWRKIEPGDGSDHDNITFLIPFDLARFCLYMAIFLATVIIIALPFYRLNPALILSPFQVNAAREPWETIWALVEGNYSYGIVPLDLRDTGWTPQSVQQSGRIPWMLVTALFGLVYGWFYTRRFDWQVPRNSLAFISFTLCLFLLWSKGYSPQWLGWVLIFVALLLPHLRGVLYATMLSLANIIEANFFFIMFPQEHWLLATTVLLRTLLLSVLAVELLWLIWPQSVTPRLEQVRRWGLAGLVVLMLVGMVPAGWRLSQSYVEQRLQQSPYRATITRLQGETVTGALLLNSHIVYDWFYPYLRQRHTFFMLDDYAPSNASVEERTISLLDNIRRNTDVLWIYDADAATTTPAEQVLTTWLNSRAPAHIQDIDGGRLTLFILK